MFYAQTSDALERSAITAIMGREGAALALRSMLRGEGSGDLATTIRRLRSATVKSVRAVDLWRARWKQPFLWPDGANWLLGLRNDLDWLSAYPRFAAWLGRSPRMNPFLVPAGNATTGNATGSDPTTAMPEVGAPPCDVVEMEDMRYCEHVIKGEERRAMGEDAPTAPLVDREAEGEEGGGEDGEDEDRGSSSGDDGRADGNGDGRGGVDGRGRGASGGSSGGFQGHSSSGRSSERSGGRSGRRSGRKRGEGRKGSGATRRGGNHSSNAMRASSSDAPELDVDGSGPYQYTDPPFAGGGDAPLGSYSYGGDRYGGGTLSGNSAYDEFNRLSGKYGTDDLFAAPQQPFQPFAPVEAVSSLCDDVLERCRRLNDDHNETLTAVNERRLAAILVQRAWRRREDVRQARRIRVALQRRREAATAIQTPWRACMLRARFALHFAALRAGALAASRTWWGHKARCRARILRVQLARRRAAVRIQSQWRCYVLRKVMLRRRAAIALQCMVRCHLARAVANRRRVALRLEQERLERCVAATAIQTLARRALARMLVTEWRSCGTRIQACARRHLVRNVLDPRRRLRDARRIQKAWRRYKQWSHVLRLLAWQFWSAVWIQKAARGWMGYRRVAAMRQEVERQHRARVRLQSWCRTTMFCWKTRQIRCAVLLQAAVRGWGARHKAITKTQLTLDTAACAIQRTVRGATARSRLVYLRGGAASIQRMWRGRMCRNRVSVPAITSHRCYVAAQQLLSLGEEGPDGAACDGGGNSAVMLAAQSGSGVMLRQCLSARRPVEGEEEEGSMPTQDRNVSKGYLEVIHGQTMAKGL